MPDVSEVLGRSLAEQARLVRDGDVAPNALVEAALTRIAEHEPRIHAYLTVDENARGQTTGALAGVPIAVKDLTSTAGLRTTFGSKVFESNVPTADAPVVERLRAAGAAIIGKANTPEFGLGAETRTEIAPAAKNPWDLTRTTGGSSGGSAAAVAAGLCSAATGSDAGGSIRLPAAWCGVAGVKTTYGRVPGELRPGGSDHPTETVGPMTRTVEDSALLLEVIAGFHPGDPSSARVAVPDYSRNLKSPGRPLRLRWGLDLGMGPSDADIASAITSAATELHSDAVRVERSTLQLQGRHPFFTMWDILAGAAVGRLGEIERDHRDVLADYAVEFIDSGRELAIAQYLHAIYEAKQLRVLLDDELERCDALMIPATAVSAWRHGEPPTEVNGAPMAAHGLIAYGGLPYLALASVTGHPVVSVPIGLDSQGLPIGVQLIGKCWDEATILQVAYALECAVGSSFPQL
ncbi:MAG TPA: amidase [Ilumatobacter sp.]|nr:amidase [Ilumatobacter sp.]